MLSVIISVSDLFSHVYFIFLYADYHLYSSSTESCDLKSLKRHTEKCFLPCVSENSFALELSIILSDHNSCGKLLMGKPKWYIHEETYVLGQQFSRSELAEGDHLALSALSLPVSKFNVSLLYCHFCSTRTLQQTQPCFCSNFHHVSSNIV